MQAFLNVHVLQIHWFVFRQCREYTSKHLHRGTVVNTPQMTKTNLAVITSPKCRLQSCYLKSPYFEVPTPKQNIVATPHR